MAHLTTKHLSNIPLELASLAFLLSFPRKKPFQTLDCLLSICPLWMSICPLCPPMVVYLSPGKTVTNPGLSICPLCPSWLSICPLYPPWLSFCPLCPLWMSICPLCLSVTLISICPPFPLWLSICPLFPPMVVYLSPLSVTLMSICPLFTPMLVYLSPLSVCHTHVYLSPLAPYGCLFVPWKNCCKPWTRTV